MVLTAPGLVVSLYLLLARADRVQNQAVAPQGVLRALTQAEGFARAHPDQARAALARVYDLSAPDLAAVWGLYDYRVALDQPLLLILGNVARWQIGQMPTDPAPPGLPNFLDFLYPDALKAVRPAAVTVIC